MVHIKRVVRQFDFDFTEGWIPSIAQLRSAQPRQTRQQRDVFGYGETTLDSQDMLAAWTLSMLVRRRLWYRFGLKCAKASSVETIVITPPRTTQATFADWFDGANPDYRLFIHVEPTLSPDSREYGHFGEIHHVNRIGLTHRYRSSVSPLLRIPVESFLGKLGQAYNADLSSVESLLDGTGHDYHRSDGLVPQL